MFWPNQPRIEKTRAFDLMRRRGAARAVLHFSGGNDEGGVEDIVIYSDDSEGKEGITLEPFDGCRVIKDAEAHGGYRYEDVPRSEWTDDELLADLLCAPVDVEFGSWAGAPYTSGTLTWNLADRTVTMKYEAEESFSVGGSKSF